VEKKECKHSRKQIGGEANKNSTTAVQVLTTSKLRKVKFKKKKP
jgi:hypothetical protein